MGNLLCRYLHAHIASGYHDTVRCLDDGVQILDALRVLNLCNNLHTGTLLIQHGLDFLNTVSCTYKGCRDEVKALPDSKTDILFVLIRQGRKLNLYIGHIDTLLLSQLSSVDDLTDNVRILHLAHFQLNQSVVNENPVARGNILIQSAVIDIADGIVTYQLPGGQGIGLAFLQSHLFAVLKLSGTDLRSLGIQERCDRNIQLLAHFL